MNCPACFSEDSLLFDQEYHFLSEEIQFISEILKHQTDSCSLLLRLPTRETRPMTLGQSQKSLPFDQPKNPGRHAN